ncbi:MAG: DASS family sodium-coupled anion symporter [Bacillota bacterium]
MRVSYRIDDRPLVLLFFLKYRSFMFLLLLGAVFFRLMSLASPFPELSQQGYYALVIFGLSVVLWVGNILPLAITSLLVMGLLSAYQVLGRNVVYSFFGDSAIFFILGAFIIAAAASSTGLSRRLAHRILCGYGGSPAGLLLSVFFLSAIMSFFMPSHAVAALLFPLLVEITRALGLEKGSRLGKFIFFALCWGAVIGSGATFLGGARIPLAAGILQASTGLEIGFLEWFVAVGPIVALMLAAGALFLLCVAGVGSERLDLVGKNREACRVGKVSFNEAKAAALLAATIYLWVFHDKTLGIANIALISAAMYFVLGLVTWEEVAREINWGTIFMFGGALALGRSLSETGVLQWLSRAYLANLSPFVFFLLVSTSATFLTEAISNTAVVAILMPVTLELSARTGLDPRVATYALATAAGLSFMLPMGTPPNAIAYASGFLTVREAVKYGLALNLLSLAVFVVMALLYWPFLGLKVL